MAEQERIYRIKYEGVQASIESLADLRERIQAVKKAQQELDTTTEKGKLQKEELLLIEKNLSEEYRKQQKEIGNRDKQLKQEADTLEKMRARLSNMRAELEKIPIGTQAFKDQQVAVKKLQEEINGADQATARFQGNVGNYKNAIIDAFQQMGINISGVSQNITKAQAAMTGLTGATGTTSTAMKVLKVALASTGIGLLIVALGSLIAYFAGTQAGIDKVNKVLEPMKQIFQRIIGIIQQFGSGLAKIFSGEFKAGFQELSNTIGSVGSQLKEAANDGSRLAQITVEIEQARIKLAENEGRLRREMAEQRTILSDISISDAKRIAAGEKFKQLRNELLGMEKVIAGLEYEQAEIRAKQNDTDREALAEIATKKEAINSLEAQALMEQKEAQTQIAGLLKKNNDQRLKAIADETAALKKAQAELTKGAIEEIENFLKAAEERRDQIEDVMDMFLTRRPQAEEEQPIEETPEIKRAIATANYKRQLEDETAAARIASIRRAIQEGAIAEAEGERIIQGIRLQQLENYTDMLGAMKGLLKQNTAAYKVVASAENIMATYMGITKWLAKVEMFPLNIAMAVTTGLQGAMNLAKINNVKFAKGGIVGGRLHEQGGTKYFGEDGNQFEVERGELITVVNRYDTERLKTLSRLNATHGRPFFASGGMMAPRTDFNNTAATRQMISEVVESITQIPVVVSEREITTSQRRVSVASKVGDL